MCYIPIDFAVYQLSNQGYRIIHESSDVDDENVNVDDENDAIQDENDDVDDENNDVFDDNKTISFVCHDSILNLTVQESSLCILAHALRFNLSDRALESQLKLVDLHLPYAEHRSKYRFLKNISLPQFIEYYFCYECAIILTFERNECLCPSCGKKYSKRILKREGEYFLYNPLESQIKEFCNSKLYKHFRKIDPDDRCVLNGKIYKKLERLGIIEQNDVTLSWNVDGVSLMKSSKKSTWSILLTINEIPYKFSKDYVILCGLWHNKKIPKMNMFLKPFAEECKHLYQNGMECTTYGRVNSIKFKVHLIVSPIDTIARPIVQNMKQFNGTYGCPYCYQKSVSLNDNPLNRVYLKNENLLRRTIQMHKKHVAEAIKTPFAVYGVKGPSIMSIIPNLNILLHFPPEYMHSWLLGITKMIVKSWFDPQFKNEPFYIGATLKIVNERLLNIKPPSELTRCPCEINDMTKASEWKNFALYYSLPVMKGILPKKYYRHWYLFIFSMHVLLQQKIANEEIELVEKSLKLFHDGIQSLYGKSFMTFKVHTLKHVISFVQYYGSIWAWSAYPYEHYNSVIKDLWHGTQCVAPQICKSYLRLKFLKLNSDVFDREDGNEKAKTLFQQLMKECNVQKCIRYSDDIKLFGKPTKRLDELDRMVLKIYIGQENLCIEIYHRFMINNTLSHTRNYNRLYMRYNCCIQTSEGELMIVNQIVKVSQNNKESQLVALGNVIAVDEQDLCEFSLFPSKKFFFICTEKTQIKCIDARKIAKKFLVAPYNKDRMCIIKLVNNIESD
ncbi:hypothetical protein TKK_0014341 [Trichogramma kaykai]